MEATWELVLRTRKPATRMDANLELALQSTGRDATPISHWLQEANTASLAWCPRLWFALVCATQAYGRPACLSAYLAPPYHVPDGDHCAEHDPLEANSNEFSNTATADGNCRSMDRQDSLSRLSLYQQYFDL